MIERYENIAQISVLTICAVLSIIQAIKQNSKTWTLLALFYGSWLLGDCYWLFCLLFFEKTPQISVVSDLSWYASYLFLFLLLQQTAPLERVLERCIFPWIGPVFTAAMAFFFMQWGEIVSNLIYAALMGLLLFTAIRRLSRRRTQFSLSLLILIFCILEYGLWVSSCFWKTDTLSNPYYWFDSLLTVSFLFFLPATKKAVSA